MLDTGCSRTMVHSDLVSEGQIREGESAVVRCAHGDTVMYPMADICVELDLGCPSRPLSPSSVACARVVAINTSARSEAWLSNLPSSLKESP